MNTSDGDKFGIFDILATHNYLVTLTFTSY